MIARRRYAYTGVAPFPVRSGARQVERVVCFVDGRRGNGRFNTLIAVLWNAFSSLSLAPLVNNPINDWTIKIELKRDPSVVRRNASRIYYGRQTSTRDVNDHIWRVRLFRTSKRRNRNENNGPIANGLPRNAMEHNRSRTFPTRVHYQ